MTSARFEWLSIPEPENDEGAAREEAAEAHFSKQCPACGWLDSTAFFAKLGGGSGAQECWRCGTRFDVSDEISAFFQRQAVSLPGVRVVRGSCEPRSFFRAGRGARWCDIHLAGRRLTLRRGFDELLCLHTARIEHLDHQIRTARTVMKRHRGRAILADEVGMGKTVEAGLVIKECLLRGLARNVLVLAPPGLVPQWKQELEEKFEETFQELRGRSPSGLPSRLISSYDRARGKAASLLSGRIWDILVLDEAQRLKNRSTKLWGFVRELRSRYVLALTATPVENDLTELYAIVDLVRPGHLGTIRAFKSAFVARSDPRAPEEGRETALKETLSDILIRNRRDQTGLHLPRRKAAIAWIAPSASEKVLYDEVTRYVRKEFKRQFTRLTGNKTRMLSLITLQRELTSSPRAIQKTLARMAGREAYPEPVRDQLSRLAELAGRIQRPSKAEALLDILALFPARRFLVFTEFQETAEHLAGLVRDSGRAAFPLTGRHRTPQRSQTLERFFEVRSSVLVSTEVGGVGLNLQKACHSLVNYDLPWNPMRVEQRIGRLDRIGQDQEITIFNLAVKGTVEEHVIDILAKKLRLFEIVVGEMGTVLGHVDQATSLQQRIGEIWLQSRSAGEAARSFRALGDALAEAREGYDNTKRVNRVLDRIGGRA